MSTEFNELLPFSRNPRLQIWIVGSHEQVMQTLNEFCIKQIAPDRAQLMPPVPVVSAPGKFITLLEW